MQFKILGTGSSGNCFLINDDIMIDAGMPYSKIKDKVKDVKYVLLTHIHGDHFNTTTMRKLSVSINPTFLYGEWLEEHMLNFNNKIAVGFDEAIDIIDGKYKIAMVQAYHDVPNCGYRIMQNGHKHLHITDTSTLDGISAIGYNSASIECNHERTKALELIDEAKENGEFTHLTGALNSHLDVNETIRFCKNNGIKKLYPVHIGSSTKKEVIQKLKEW
jgi:phosphoribosyl 1,2-cyclic phosphodiesterase